MAGIVIPMFAIDTLQFSERLIKEGMKPKLAKVLVEEFKEIGEQSIGGLATKADLSVIKADLLVVKADLLATKADLSVIKADLSVVKADLLATKADLKSDIALLRHEIKIAMLTTIISIGIMIVTAVGIVSWLSKAVSGGL